jgi:hypothetical protein
MAKQKSSPRLDLRVTFGDVAIGDQTARVAVKIDRGNFTIDQADDTLCGRRISGRLVLTNGDNEGQEKLPGMGDVDHAMEGVADVKQYSVTAKHISCTLSFSLRSIDLDALCHFAKRAGKLTIEGVEAIPEDEETEGEEEADEAAGEPKPRKLTGAARFRQPQPQPDEAWKATPLDFVLGGAVTAGAIEKLGERGLHTLGDLDEFRAKHQLAEVPGIGAAKVGKIEAAIAEYWRKNLVCETVASVAAATEEPGE